MKKALLFSLLLFILFSCTSKKENTEAVSQLGELQHEFTISESAKPSFEEGLLRLHSFEYEDAREAFQKAIEADPGELMAYWGEAMSHYRALWGLQDVPAGREVMARLGDTKEERLSRAENQLERGFWLGVEILYGEGELDERNSAYADHMGRLYEKYEDNQEVAAFYALGLMWSVPVGRDANVSERSAQVAAGILEENPNHPGALHYMIHAYDDPEYANLAKEAANTYAKVAPDATHALHMPSHIYLALGMWNEVVASNEASYAASVNRMKRKQLGDAARGYHSYAWLHYAYLQQGRFDKAAELLADMHTFTTSAETAGARSYLIVMQNAQIVETGKWPLTAEPMHVKYYDLGLMSKVGQHFFKGMMAFEDNNADLLRAEADTIYNHLTAAELVVTDEGVSLCSAGPTRYAPNKSDITRAQVVIHQMEAMMALLNNDKVLAEDHFKKAVTLETESQYSFGPPDIPYPSFEQYGDWLLEEKRFEEALEQFNASLSRAPNRAKALKGKIAALKKLERLEEAEETQKVLDEFWQQDLVAMNLL